MSGEDSHYFLRAHLRGCKIVWTNAAVVREVVPAQSPQPLLDSQTSDTRSNTRALIELEAYP